MVQLCCRIFVLSRMLRGLGFLFKNVSTQTQALVRESLRDEAYPASATSTTGHDGFSTSLAGEKLKSVNVVARLILLTFYRKVLDATSKLRLQVNLSVSVAQ